MMFSVSCNNDDWLKEDARDFYTADNSYTTYNDFCEAVNYLYSYFRSFHQKGADNLYPLYYGTDFAMTALDQDAGNLHKLNDYANTMVPTWYCTYYFWTSFYKLITCSNTILSRTGSSEMSDDEIDKIRGQAYWFRGYAYDRLANLYGGVPIIIDEITTVKKDYIRCSREETYIQAKNDLIAASNLLDNIDEVADGKVSKQLAQHMLTEVYNNLGKCESDLGSSGNDYYTKAIAEADSVINYPSMGLMTQRFGAYKDHDGDVYSDLFRDGNVNRSTSGNTETLLALQFDYQAYGSSTSCHYNQFCNCHYTNLNVSYINNKGETISVSAFTNPTTQKGGRSIGWMRGTPYFYNKVLTNDTNDIRNSKYNIIRDAKIDNTEFPGYGKWLVADGYLNDSDTMRYWYPIMTKLFSTTVPDEYYSYDNTGNIKTTSQGEDIVIKTCNQTFKDMYVFRLAETYLLKAEAYIQMEGNGSQNAADAINVVRERSNCSDVLAEDVDIDYLLDERMRELYMEELRMPLLCRLGMQYSRTKKYNPWSGLSIEEYHNLWPIPYQEIERNTEAIIEQNPGYN